MKNFSLTRQGYACAKAGIVIAAFLAVWIVQEKPAWAVYKYCATITPTYLDSNRGEDILIVPQGGALTASYHYYQIRNAQNQTVISGYFDVNGCATTTTSVGTGQFRVWPLVRRGSVPNTMVIRAKYFTADEELSYAVLNINRPSSAGAGITTVTYPIGTFAADLFRASAVAAAVPISLLIAGEDWTIVTRANTDIECLGAGGCAGGGQLFLGQDDNGTWNNQRKAVIAHELGHLVQEALIGDWSSPGSQGSVDYSDTPDNTTYCSCWYVPNPDDRSHCMTSREFLSAAFGEAWGHFIGTRTLNDPAGNNAIFPYYKPELLPSAQQPPTCGNGGSCTVVLAPVAHNALAAHRWLERQCPVDMDAHRATEMDWLGLLYNLNVSQAYSANDMFSIMHNSHTCGTICEDTDEITWSDMNLAVNAQGFGDTKEQAFNLQSILYGVKR